MIINSRNFNNHKLVLALFKKDLYLIIHTCTCIRIYFVTMNCIGDVMVGVLAYSAVSCEFKPKTI